MGWLSDTFSWAVDDVLGFDPPKVSAPAPAAQPGVATTDPSTNTPTPTPAQASYDEMKSYLQAQAQRNFNLQLKKITSKTPIAAPPTFSQTVQGKKLIKFGIVSALAWLFLFSKNG